MSANFNIVINQGATLNQNIIIKNSSGDVTDLSGYSSRGQIRREYEDTSAIVELTTDIVSPPSAGTINIALTPAQTEEINSGSYVYDIEIINTSTDAVTRVVSGNVTVYPEVTRDSSPGGGNFAA